MSTQNNNGYARVSVTTNSLTFFDENGVMMKMAFFNETYSITLCPPVITAEGKRTYPSESRESFIITADRAAALYNDIILTKVMGAIEEKRNYNGGIFLSTKKDRVFELRVQDNEVYAIYHIDIDADRKPKKSYVFKFAKTPLIEQYNPDSGAFEMDDVHAQFLLFIKSMDGFLMFVNGISAHSHRYTNKFTTDKIFKYLEDIAVKLGVSINTAPRSNPFNNDHNNPENATMPPMTETNDLNSLLLS